MSDQIAHLLRRATMAAHPERLDALANRSLDDAIGALIGEVSFDDEGSAAIPWPNSAGPPEGEDEPWGAAAVWWVNRMSSRQSGLQDRMAWLWHNWFTTNDEAYDSARISADQIDILYRYGLSDLRTLTREVITSPAMLFTLDAVDSEAYNPNENLARELMELFTIGPGNYTENDVRAGARALAGWRVDDDTGKAWLDQSASFVAPLIFLNTQDEWDTNKVIDTLVDHPATARRVVSFLWYQLVGVEVDEGVIDDLASSFVDDELRILPLVERMLRSDQFAGASHARFGSGIEWLVAVLAATDPGGNDWLEPWHMENLGQRPLAPPSPAGWPAGEFWVRPGSLLARLQLLQDLESGPMERARAAADIVSAAALPEGDPAIGLIEEILRNDRFEPPDRRRIAWRIALSSPTFQRH